MLNPKKKQRIIKKYRTHDTDTGSTEVQIAILTEEIKELTGHLKEHRHDFSSRKGLLKKVNDRRKLLRYLERENLESFHEIVKKLKLKIAKRLSPIPSDAEEEESEEQGESKEK